MDHDVLVVTADTADTDKAVGSLKIPPASDQSTYHTILVHYTFAFELVSDNSNYSDN